MRVLNVVGARPNFMKMAPLVEAMKFSATIEPILLHTGQHYDRNMSGDFFEQLGLPEPDIHLGIGSGSDVWQTAQIMLALESELAHVNPDLVLVVGDVSSTLAAALVAAKRKVPVAHVEAGLRSFDRKMPEELNRRLTDAISDLLFTTCRDAGKNLIAEGIDPVKIHFVGNLMAQTLLAQLERAKESAIRTELGLASKAYGLVTLHRPSNVDDPTVLHDLIQVLGRIAHELPLVFPLHPRTAASLDSFGLRAELSEELLVVPPLPYREMLNLMANAEIVLTDSGGMQEETTVLGVPCLTLRENTERPITVSEGTNCLVGSKPENVWRAFRQLVHNDADLERVPKYWDPHVADRIIAVIESSVGGA